MVFPAAKADGSDGAPRSTSKKDQPPPRPAQILVTLSVEQSR